MKRGSGSLESTPTKNSTRQTMPLLEQLLITLLVVLYSLASHTNSQSHAVETDHGAPSCRHSYNFTFLVFVPCLQGSENEVVPFSTDPSDILTDRLDDCDLLAGVAMRLAIEKVNEDGSILPNSFLKEESLFSHSLPTEHQTQDTFLLHAQAVYDGVRFINSDEHIGVIGPSDPAIAAFWAPIFQRSNLLTVSYDVTSNGPDRALTFYRTLPSQRAANVGLLALIARFGWYRIAIVSSQDGFFVEMAESFFSLVSSFLTERRRYGVYGNVFISSFGDSPDSALRELGADARDIRIIFGFFNSKDAQRVLCRAYHLNLVTENHAWILPGYYNPNWWKRSTAECDSEIIIENVLESTIFVNTVKYPPVDMSLDEFHGKLIAKAVDLFPSLTKEDLKPYLLRSRATNAYDAVTLLAKSVDVALNQSGDGCYSIDTEVVQVALEKVFMECEYCKLNPAGCMLNDNDTVDLCGIDYSRTPTLEQFAQSYPHLLDKGLRMEHLLNYYGQVSYSQFIDGEECIVAFLWNFTYNDTFADLESQMVTLDSFDGSSFAMRLNLSQTNFIAEGSKCPSIFQWKSETGPPKSFAVIRFGFPLYQIILVGLATGLGLIISVLFLIFNIVWRKNKFVKSTSPWLNVILITGIIISLPDVLFQIIVLSVSLYDLNTKFVYPTCRLTNLYLAGNTIFVSALLMKIWRLYRIFNNKSQRQIGKNLTDGRLSIVILFMVLPTTIILIVMSSLPVELQIVPFPDEEKLQFHNFSFCRIEYGRDLIPVMQGYNFILAICLLILTLHIALINLPTFQREALYSLRAVTIVTVPVISLYALDFFIRWPSLFSIDNLGYILLIHGISAFILPLVILFILFIPNAFVVLKSHFKKRRKVSSQEDQASNELLRRYSQLTRKCQNLKKELSEINKKIAEISSERLQQTSPSQPADNLVYASIKMDSQKLLKPVTSATAKDTVACKQDEKSTQCVETLLTYLIPEGGPQQSPSSTSNLKDSENVTSFTEFPTETSQSVVNREESTESKVVLLSQRELTCQCRLFLSSSAMEVTESETTFCTVVSTTSEEESASVLSGEGFSDAHGLQMCSDFIEHCAEVKTETVLGIKTMFNESSEMDNLCNKEE